MPSHAQGMSLRDWFAGMAMQPAYRMAVRDNDYYAEQDHQKGFGKGDAVARNAYAIADAMLAERAKQ